MTEIQQIPAKLSVTVARGQIPTSLAASLPLVAMALTLVTLRCWFATHMDFETDEAYYWLWSRSLAASYFDHPPMVAYLIPIGTSLFGDGMLGTAAWRSWR